MDTRSRNELSDIKFDTSQKNIEMEEHLTRLGKSLPGFIFEFCLDTAGVFTIPFVTEGIDSIFQMDPELIKNDASMLFNQIVAEDREPFLQSIRESAITLLPWVFEWRIYKNNKEILLKGHSTPIKRETGVHWYGYIEDITDNRANEVTISLIREQEKTMIQTMQEGIVIQDLSGKILSTNKSAEQILGLTYEQMIGLTSIDPRWQAIDEKGNPLSGENHPAMITIQTKVPIKNFIMGVRKTGTDLTWISINTQIIYHPITKEALQVFAVFHDITERKNIERALIESKQKAESAEKIKSAFLANMSHEIRTPLNAIIGYTDLLIDGDHSEETKNQLNIIKNSGNLLLNIINDILDLSKIEANQMKINEFPFSLNEVSARISEYASLLLSKKSKKLNFEVYLDNDLPKLILGDEYRILQVMLNLVNNAIKFTEDGSIRIEILLCGETNFKFIVKDTGKGILEENYDRIFQPFQQEDFSDVRQYGGTGLGLTISKKLIEKMGGRISFQSSVREEHGTCFEVILPFKKYESQIPSVPKSDSIRKDLKKDRVYKILLAEDDRINQILAEKILKNVGYTVTTASNGYEAVSSFKKEAFDLILMDVQMPRKTGFEATEEIRKYEKENHNGKRIPILFLSAAALSEDREQGFQVGGDYYLTKPLNKEELIDAINRYISA